MTKNKCNLLLNDLISPSKLPKSANIFFELFLEDGKGNYIDVPVLNRNYIDDQGKKPNTGYIISDNWKLSRRFIIYDSISGIKEENSYLEGTGRPEYVRWANDVNLKIEMDMTNPE